MQAADQLRRSASGAVTRAFSYTWTPSSQLTKAARGAAPYTTTTRTTSDAHHHHAAHRAPRAAAAVVPAAGARIGGDGAPRRARRRALVILVIHLHQLDDAEALHAVEEVALHLLDGRHLEHVARDVARPAVGDGADDPLDRGDEERADGEVVQPEPEEHERALGVGGHLAAHPDPLAAALRCLHHVVHGAQHGGVERLVERRHLAVAAVDGEEVLDQVVGPDGEEVDLADELVGERHRRRHLDHHAHLHAGLVLAP